MTPPIHCGRSASGRTAATLILLGAVLMAGCITQPDDGPPVETDTVRIPGAWVFEPANIQVANDTTVTWVNDGGQPHTVTFEALGIDKTVQPGETVEIHLDRPGSYSYVCRFHPPDMAGTVEVTAGAGNQSLSSSSGSMRPY